VKNWFKNINSFKISNFLKSAKLYILLWRLLIEILKRKTYIENMYDTQSLSFDYKNYGPKILFSYLKLKCLQTQIFGAKI